MKIEDLKLKIAQDNLSVKVFRHTGNKWSRQSEELPLHRALDLAILVISSLKNKSSNLLNEVKVGSADELKDIQDYYKNNKAMVDSRLNELKRLLQ